MVPSATQIYEHVSVLLVVADPLDEAAASDRVTLERRKAHRPAIFDRNDLGFCCGQPRLGLSGFSGLLVELIERVALYGWSQLGLPIPCCAGALNETGRSGAMSPTYEDMGAAQARSPWVQALVAAGGQQTRSP